MQNRFVKIINEINKLIKSAAPPEFKDSWQVSVTEAVYPLVQLTIIGPLMFLHEKTGITFKEIIEHCLNDTQRAF